MLRSSSTSVRGFVVASALASSLVARESHAQNTQADTLVAQGVSLRQAGNDDEALAVFRRAYELQHAPRILAQIALAEQALGHWVDADAHLHEAIAVTTDPWISRNTSALQNALDVIGRHLGSLDVRSNVAGAELWINDERAGTLPLRTPIRVPSGSANVEVRAQGHRTVRRVVEVSPGILSRETVNLTASASARAEPGEPAATPTNATTTTTTSTPAATTPGGTGPSDTGTSAGAPVGPIALIALGAISFGAAGAFYALRGSAIGNCMVMGDNLVCPTQADAMRAQMGGTWTALTNTFMIVGGVSLVAGAIWLLVRGGGASSTRGSLAQPPRATLDVMPTAGGMYVGLSGTL